MPLATSDLCPERLRFPFDRSGANEVGSPLLTVDEHGEFLSQIALAMWEAKVDYLKRDALEFIADYFCETAQKNAFQAQQFVSVFADTRC